jgi:hypothetical protein
LSLAAQSDYLLTSLMEEIHQEILAEDHFRSTSAPTLGVGALPAAAAAHVTQRLQAI